MPIYYTVQHVKAYENLVSLGHLVGDENYGWGRKFEPQYTWMKEQMKKRLPRYKGEQPIWLWVKKPDMRLSAWGEKGEKLVRLTLELDAADVLISDFNKWHCVLNNWHYFHTAQEDADHENGLVDISMEKSWEGIFDEYDDTHADMWGPKEAVILQGTTGKILIDKVKKVEHFLAR